MLTKFKLLAVIFSILLVGLVGMMIFVQQGESQERVPEPAAAQDLNQKPNTVESDVTRQLATSSSDDEVGKGLYFAVVNSDGTLARKRKAVSSTKLNTGNYEVIFNDNVRNCAYTATIGLSGFSGAENTGEITVVGRVTDVRGVFITTNDSTGSSFADRGFHLVVNCKP